MKERFRGFGSLLGNTDMDKIADMLTVIRNGGQAGKSHVQVPFSRLKQSIAECLVEHGYLAKASKKTLKENKDVLEMELITTGTSPRIKDVKRISKPSRRVYMGVRDIKPYKNGLGTIVLSTPKGILGDNQARKEQVGGEVLFKIW